MSGAEQHDRGAPTEHTAPWDDERGIEQALHSIGARHGLGAVKKRYAEGSCPVFALAGRRVVKLFAPQSHEHFATENEVLGYLAKPLGGLTPALHGAGEAHGWLYLVMDEMPGRPLRQVWDEVPPAERARIAETLGQTLARLHELPAENLTALRRDWGDFLVRQRRECVARQAKNGLEPRWLKQIPDFLDTVELDPPERPVLLHTEIMREHVLVDHRAGTWQLSGLVDFEPAMLGHPEYEFASVGVFFAEGDPEVLRAVVDAYHKTSGRPAAWPHLGQRFLAYTLLHRYSNLSWYLQRMPPYPGVTTLHDLAAQWWPLA